jgi:hypothetical protein
MYLAQYPPSGKFSWYILNSSPSTLVREPSYSQDESCYSFRRHPSACLPIPLQSSSKRWDASEHSG